MLFSLTLRKCITVNIIVKLTCFSCAPGCPLQQTQTPNPNPGLLHVSNGKAEECHDHTPFSNQSTAISMIVTQTTVGVVLGVSVIINITLVIIVAVLLIKIKAKGSSSQPMPADDRNEMKEETEDFEMKANELYAVNIMTKPNEVYGVTSSTGPRTYEFVNP